MIGLLQRVGTARVEVAGETVGAIETGLLVLVGVERGDREEQADRLLNLTALPHARPYQQPGDRHVLGNVEPMIAFVAAMVRMD